MASSVVITGFGVVSPLGDTMQDVVARVCAGESAVRPIPELGLDGAWGAMVGDVPLEAEAQADKPRAGRLDRLSRLFLAASYRAVGAAGLHLADEDRERVGLSFGTGLGCLLTNAEYNEKIVAAGPSAASPRLFAYTVSSAAAGEVSIALGIRGANVTMHAGFAAGVQAIGYAYDLLQAGKADVVLAGGADALGPAVVRGLADMHLLRSRPAAPFEDAVPGFEPSEGAVVAVLERRDRAERRGARCLARVEGYAMGFEPTLTHRRRESTGLQHAMTGALRQSGRTPQEVGAVITSAHGTPIDAVEVEALAAVFRDCQPALFAPKRAWGECCGASGALGATLATALLQQPIRVADGVTWTLADDQVRPGSGPLDRLGVAMVHALCYSGTTVALLVGHEE